MPEPTELKKTRRFVCENCGAVEFEITVELNYPIDKEKAQWLEDCAFCPGCGGLTEDV